MHALRMHPATVLHYETLSPDLVHLNSVDEMLNAPSYALAQDCKYHPTPVHKRTKTICKHHYTNIFLKKHGTKEICSIL